MLQTAAGVSLVLACTKWDVLKDTGEPEGLRVLAHALRWLAHSNAAHLVYLEGLQPSGATGGVAYFANTFVLVSLGGVFCQSGAASC